jgi:hypothetical protein
MPSLGIGKVLPATGTALMDAPARLAGARLLL